MSERPDAMFDNLNELKKSGDEPAAPEAPAPAPLDRARQFCKEWAKAGCKTSTWEMMVAFAEAEEGSVPKQGGSK